MLLYLDLNCFNRPFNDQSQARIARETEAVYAILQRIVDGADELVWSDILDIENSQHPIRDRSVEIAQWAGRAAEHVIVSEDVIQRAQVLIQGGLDPLDAAHVACAEAAGCERFLTCDDRLLRRARRMALSLTVQNPVEYIEERTHA